MNLRQSLTVKIESLAHLNTVLEKILSLNFYLISENFRESFIKQNGKYLVLRKYGEKGKYRIYHRDDFCNNYKLVNLDYFEVDSSKNKRKKLNI